METLKLLSGYVSAVAIEVLLIGWETHLHYNKTKGDFFFNLQCL